ncbi:mitochondrial genome maintenance MGM101-domain-containing protein [Cladochytrium replicatum]|nr:mitochondrial genome maintenance MGM101-domain-containing protein [Cladochytrium replicatum]
MNLTLKFFSSVGRTHSRCNFKLLQNALLHTEQHAPPSEKSRSIFEGIASARFPRFTADLLTAPANPSDIRIHPNGLIFYPPEHYRNLLDRAIPTWRLVPMTSISFTPNTLSREYALVVDDNRFVASARGEASRREGVGAAQMLRDVEESAIARTCKDLGVWSELWDPVFCKAWRDKWAVRCWGVKYGLDGKEIVKVVWKLRGGAVMDPWKEKTGLPPPP